MSESRHFFTEDYGFCRLRERRRRLKIQDLLQEGIKMVHIQGVRAISAFAPKSRHSLVLD